MSPWIAARVCVALKEDECNKGFCRRCVDCQRHAPFHSPYPELVELKLVPVKEVSTLQLSIFQIDSTFNLANALPIGPGKELLLWG